MSGFEKFQSSDNWLNRFRNFLTEKRSISPPKMDSPNSSSPTIDFDQDFQEILEEKCPSFKLSHENKENCLGIYKASKSTFITNKDFHLNNNLTPMSPTTPPNCLETTANDSFFYLETICNKTISDPDSTIHSYVENMRKTNSLIQNNTTKEFDENDIVKKISSYDIDGNYLPERTIYHVGDQTQLGDIEAPSGIWDTTISDATLLQMSPTKRVGLLRPSTILEEPNSSYSGSETSGINSSVFSFKTAMKSSETTSYETANDTIRSEIMKRNNITLDENKSSKYDKLYGKEYSINKNKPSKDSAFFDNLSSSDQDKIIDLSDQLSDKNTLDEVSSILDDDSLNNYSKNQYVDLDSLEMGKTLNDTKKDLSTDSVIAISDEEDNEDSELNKGFSLQSINDEDNNDLLDETLSDSNANGINVSHVFNDTFEEVDYILKQGMKNMTSLVLPITIKNSGISTSRLNVYTPSPKNSPKTPNTIISKQFAIKKITSSSLSDKKDSFKKPLNYGVGSRIPQSKLNVKKINQYSNIISPVGAYIKNTPKTPIVSNIHETNMKSIDYGKLPKVTSSCKQQLYKNNFHGQSSLPKKAYQSSEYREVRDERTLLNIPGGNKIHKYLQPALIPTVARHEGKMKIMKSTSVDSNSDNYSPVNNPNRTVDSSLADLSIMSGDVSVYTMRDAQNFK